MTRKNQSSPIGPGADLRIDYILIASAMAAALLALVYLILT